MILARCIVGVWEYDTMGWSVSSVASNVISEGVDTGSLKSMGSYNYGLPFHRQIQYHCSG